MFTNRFVATSFLLISFLSFSISQDSLDKTVKEHFSAYTISTIQTEEIYDIVKDASKFHNIQLVIGSDVFELELWDSQLRSPNYQLTRVDESEPLPSTSPIPLKGYVNNDPSSNVRLTINHGFLYGYIIHNGTRLNIQPAYQFDKQAGHNVMIAYYDKHIIEPSEPATCGVHAHEAQMQEMIGGEEHMNNNTAASSSMGLCYEVEIALAADFLMFQDHGSSTSTTENQMTGVLNDVQGNYDDEFADELQYFHTESFISNCSSCDPWSNTTNGSDLLSEFRSWGPSGFSFGHDVASLWTDRNFDDGSGNFGTVGLAYVGVVCNSFRYNLLEDYTTSSWQLRVLQAHELGHNWDYGHDASGSGFIMAPSVNNSNTWSSASITEIENYYNSIGCLSSCASSTPPTANFSFLVIEGCAPGEVEYYDSSTGATSWSWSFPGGTPATSTLQNPIVNYIDEGTYTASLTATNSGGSDTYTSPTAVLIDGIPTANYSYIDFGLSITFVDGSMAGSAPTHFWDFGDGNMSTSASPTHDYSAPGTYTVLLEVANACGVDTYTEVIEVYDSPVADFAVSVQNGCVPLSVQYTDVSYGNIVSWNWTFDGGTPASSTDENPMVVYNVAGIYDVSLEVTNTQGMASEVKTGFIAVSDVPDVGFSFAVTDADVDFTNTSSNASNYSWSFGDGNSSTDQDPMHTYGASGTYEVILSATNPCGTVMDTQDVVISLVPIAMFATTPSPAEGCANYTVQYNDMSPGNPTTWNWTFPGGSPATSDVQNPSVTYSDKGVYDVSLEVTNAMGSSDTTYVDLVTIDDVPEISASYTNNILVVDFTSTVSNANSIVWDFDDGNSSTMANPTHTYAMEGMYNVTLTASNDCGTETYNLSVSVSSLPTAGFTVGTTEGCLPLTVSYIDNSGGNPTAWNWTFPGGTPASSNMQNPTVVYNSTGVFDATLEVTNAAGTDVITNTDLVTVETVPVADYDLSVSGNEISITNLTPNTTAEWSISDGSNYSVPTTTHTFDSNGSYEVTLEVSNDCGMDVVTFTVEINAYPEVAYGISGGAGCAPYSVTYENTSTNGGTALWEFEGGTPATSTDNNPLVVYSQSGSFDVMLTMTNQYGETTLLELDAIVIDDVPEASFTESAMGSSVEFTNTTTNATSYAWDFGDSNTSNLENPTHSYVNPGMYEVELTAFNDCGSHVSTITVDVDFSTPGISASFSTANGCAPLEVMVTDNSSNDPTAWFWEFPGGSPATSTDQNPVVQYTQAGTYDIMAEISNADGSSSFTFVDAITVGDVPQADFDFMTTDAFVEFTNLSINANSYAWDFGDSNSSTLENPTHTYAASGDYDVELTAFNDCGEMIVSEKAVITISSIDDLDKLEAWNIVPNPSNGRFNIVLETALDEDLRFQIIDVLGRVLNQGSILQNSNSKEVELQSKGTHFIKLVKGNKSFVKKVVIL